MPADEVQICNIALIKVGEKTITALTDDNKAGRLCNAYYSFARDDTLRAHPWNFAVRRQELALSATIPPYEFSNQFALPDECLRVIYADLPRGSEWKVEGKFILCDYATLIIKFIKRITDTAQFDTLFAEALAARLAYEFAIALSDSRTLQEQLFKIYMGKIANARTVDAQEGTPENIEASTWLDSRHRYTGSLA